MTLTFLTDNYYINGSNIHTCFPIKTKKKSDTTADIDKDLIIGNNFFAHWVKEISITKYGTDKKLPPTFSPWEVYQYSDQMLKHACRFFKNNSKNTSLQ